MKEEKRREGREGREEKRREEKRKEEKRRAEKRKEKKRKGLCTAMNRRFIIYSDTRFSIKT